MSLPPGSEDKVTPYPLCETSTDTKDELDTVEAIDDEEASYPEGGLRAWLVVLGSFCGMYVTRKTGDSVRRLTVPKARMLWLHEQHQHLQHLLIYTPTVAVQYELNRMDLQHIHLPDLPVRHLCRTHIRC
jgi:hypothetical protein